MNYRVATLLPEEAQTAAGTKTIDIDITDVISRIQIKLDRNKSKNSMDAHPAADITKIELVDGSDVLFSMTGYEAQALNIYDRRCGSMCEGTRITGNDQISHYALDFGRFLWDTELAFDPRKFVNPQLKVSHTLATSDTGVTSGSMEVRAWAFDEKKPSPVGFLQSKEIYSYTCGAANSYEYIELPVDYPIRKLLMRGFRDGYQPADQITEFRLDENVEKKIPIDIGVETYYSFMLGYWELVKELIAGYSISPSYNFYVTPTWYWECVVLSQHSSFGPFIDTAFPGGKIAVSATGPVWFEGYVTGYFPNHCIELPFGLQNDMADWYDVTKLEKVRLRLKAGSSGTSGTAQVVLQQLRSY